MKKITIMSIALLAIVHISFTASANSGPRYDMEMYNSQFYEESGKKEVNKSDFAPSLLYYDDNIFALDFTESYLNSDDITLRADGDWLWGDGADSKTGAPIGDSLWVILALSGIYVTRSVIAGLTRNLLRLSGDPGSSPG